MRILVVEPSAAARLRMHEVLEIAGCDLAFAADGMEALAALAASRRPDLIVSEILTPRMDGFALCREVRRRRETASIPFFFYTESDDEEAAALARRIGADAFVAKSAGADALLASLRALSPERVAESHGRADLLADAAELHFRYEHLSCLFRLLERKVGALEQANAELATRDAYLRALIETEPGCVALLAPDGSIKEINPAGLRLFEADSLPQARRRSIVELAAQEDRDALRALIERVLGGRADTLTFRALGLKGRRAWLETHAAPLRDAAGAVVAVVAVARDVTARREGEEALREAEARLRLATQGAQIGIWDWDLKSGAIVWSRRHEELWGMAPGTFRGTHEEFDAAVHPDDRPALNRAVREAIEQRRPYRHDYRVLQPDGSVRWVSGRGEPIVDGAGEPVRMIGTVVDVSETKRAEEALRESRRVFETLLANLPGLVYRCRNDERWSAEFASEGCVALTGYFPSDFTSGAMSYAELIHPDDRENVRREVRAALAAGRPFQVLHRIRTRDGEVKVAWGQGRAVSRGDDGTEFIEGFITDVTDRYRAEEKVRRLNRVYAIMSGINSLIVRVRDREELFREATRLAVEAGRVQMAWIGVVDRMQNRVRPVAWAGGEPGVLREIDPRLTLDAGPDGRRSLSGEVVASGQAVVINDTGRDPRLVLKETFTSRGIGSLAILPLVIGGQVVAVITLSAHEPGFFDDEEMRLLAQLASDIAFGLDHIDKEEQLSYLAYYDSLTGLANRALFHERLEQFVQTAERERQRFALCIIDLDHFKYVNDSLGRQAGDTVLAQLGQRLLGSVPDAGQLARLGADRFALILPRARGEGEVAHALEGMRRQWTGEPFLLGGSELRLSTRIGIALFPGDGADADTLFRNSEAALKKAKTGGDPFLFYTEQMTDRVAEKLALTTRLRRALERGEFEVHYQPKVDAATRRIAGLEALIRWRDPDEGLVLPAKFIPLLEETGIIADAGAWVLQQAVRDHDHWTAHGLAPPRIAVNVSAAQLRRRDFLETARRALGTRRSPAPIELEITESVLMENIEENVELLKALDAEGIGIAIDDFGTGYSSLGYLARLPTQTLKIDLSFVSRMLTDRDVLTLVSTMISLAHSLRLRVVAEGVETEQQAEVLRRLGCDELQGYLISPPLPRARITELLECPGPAGTGAATGEPRAPG